MINKGNSQIYEGGSTISGDTFVGSSQFNENDGIDEVNDGIDGGRLTLSVS